MSLHDVSVTCHAITIELNVLGTGFVFQEQDDLYAEKERNQKDFIKKNLCPAGKSYCHVLQEDDEDDDAENDDEAVFPVLGSRAFTGPTKPKTRKMRRTGKHDWSVVPRTLPQRQQPQQQEQQRVRVP